MKKIKKIEKILIAGVTGMVGKSIYNAYKKKIKNKLISEKVFLTPSRKQLDFSNYQKLNLWFKKNKPDIVIMAAAKVGGIIANKNQPYEFILENLKIQTNLIELSYLNNVKKLLFLGSSCIYPKFSKQPIIEEDLLEGSLESTNEFYAIAKIAGIKLCESLVMQKGFNAICLMPTNLYGPGDNYNSLNSHVLPALIKRFSDAKKNKLKSVTCWGSGSPLREFLYVEDLAEACIFAIDNWNPTSVDAPKDKNGKILVWLNVGTSCEISIKNLAEMISDLVGFKGKILWDKLKPDGTPRKKLNTIRLKQLGWEAKTDLIEGIIKTIKIYNKDLENNKIRN